MVTARMGEWKSLLRSLLQSIPFPSTSATLRFRDGNGRNGESDMNRTEEATKRQVETNLRHSLWLRIYPVEISWFRSSCRSFSSPVSHSLRTSSRVPTVPLLSLQSPEWAVWTTGPKVVREQRHRGTDVSTGNGGRSGYEVRREWPPVGLSLHSSLSLFLHLIIRSATRFSAPIHLLRSTVVSLLVPLPTVGRRPPARYAVDGENRGT